jgi:lipopolysaccharide heptosyltransferase II
MQGRFMVEKQLQQMSIDKYGYPLRPDSRRWVRNIFVRFSKQALLAIIYLVMAVVGLLARAGRVRNHYAPLDAEHFHPRRILVIRLDLIGDLVLSLTLVRVLKRSYPEAEIDLLALPSSATIASADPDLAMIMPYDPNVWRRPKALVSLKHWRDAIRLLRQLRGRKYDLAVSVFGTWAGLLALLSGTPRRVGFGRESYPGFMTDSVKGRHWRPGDHKHEVDYCLELARAAGAHTTEEDRIPHLSVNPQARKEVELLLEQEGSQAAKPLIACHVSSHNGQSKRWPLPYWSALLDRLIAEDEAGIVLTGAPNDMPFIEAVTRRMKEKPVVLAGKTSLPQLAALFERSDLLISGDSGPMHIAAAVGSSLIAIHGPTDPALSGPVSPRASVLRSPIWCSPCYHAKGPADCRFYTTQCMKDITPDQVLNAVHERLRESEHYV